MAVGGLSRCAATWHPSAVALYNRVFAVAYDPVLAIGERTGMRAIRRRVLGASVGRVLEIGAGTGLNLGLYPTGVESLTFAEPDPAMRSRFVRQAARLRLDHEPVAATAERLPFGDDSFDTVVSTLVLCTVPDVGPALQEIDRVLAPGGRLVLVEHVRADGPGLAGWQDRLHGAWRRFAAGCHCNRDTEAELAAAGFGTGGLNAERWPSMPPIVSPLITGVAHRSTEGQL